MSYWDSHEWRAKCAAREAEERETMLRWLAQQEPRPDLLALAAERLADRTPDQLHRWLPGILNQAFRMRAPGKPSYSKPFDERFEYSGWRALRFHGYRIGHIWHRGERNWIGVHAESKTANPGDAVATGTNRNAVSVALGEYDRDVYIARATWIRDRLADQRPEVLEAEAALDKLSPPEARRLLHVYQTKLDRR